MQKLDLKDFTHKASFYGIPCYFNVDNCLLAGTNIVFDYLIPIVAWIHNYFVQPFFSEPAFPIRVLDKL